MSEGMFEFDIDAQLEQAQARARDKVEQLPSEALDEAECESCKI